MDMDSFYKRKTGIGMDELKENEKLHDFLQTIRSRYAFMVDFARVNIMHANIFTDTNTIFLWN